MKEVKRWAIIKEPLDQADCIWIKNNSDNFVVNHKVEDVPTFGNNGFSKIYLGSEVILQTTSKEQEAMLRLKYADKLILLTVVFLDAGQQFTDHFGTMYATD